MKLISADWYIAEDGSRWSEPINNMRCSESMFITLYNAIIGNLNKGMLPRLKDMPIKKERPYDVRTWIDLVLSLEKDSVSVIEVMDSIRLGYVPEHLTVRDK